MKKNVLLLVGALFALAANSQVIYTGAHERRAIVGGGKPKDTYEHFAITISDQTIEVDISNKVKFYTVLSIQNLDDRSEFFLQGNSKKCHLTTFKNNEILLIDDIDGNTVTITVFYPTKIENKD